MGKVTIRLPNTLHQQLKDLAESEGVSLSQYIVYILTHQAAVADTGGPHMDEEEWRQQQEEFQELVKEFGQASVEEIEQLLGGSEGEPEPSGEKINRQPK